MYSVWASTSGHTGGHSFGHPRYRRISQGMCLFKDFCQEQGLSAKRPGWSPHAHCVLISRCGSSIWPSKNVISTFCNPKTQIQNTCHQQIQGSWGPGPPPVGAKIFSKSCTFQAILSPGKTPILSKFWAQRPLTKILDPPSMRWQEVSLSFCSVRNLSWGSRTSGFATGPRCHPGRGTGWGPNHTYHTQSVEMHVMLHVLKKCNPQFAFVDSSEKTPMKSILVFSSANTCTIKQTNTAASHVAYCIGGK